MSFGSRTKVKPFGGWLFYFLFLGLLGIGNLFFRGILGGVGAVSLTLVALAVFFGLKRVRPYFGGFGFVNLLAEEFGIDKRVFGTALTEMGVNYAFLRIEGNALKERGFSESEVIKALAMKNAISASVGLSRLRQRYPSEEQIRKAQRILIDYSLRNGFNLKG